MIPLQIRLSPEVCEILAKLSAVHTDPKTVYCWMTTKNPNLGGFSPLYLINVGRAHKVLEFISQQME